MLGAKDMPSIYGDRDDESYVPQTYVPRADEREEYEQGQQTACIKVMDTEG